MGRREVAAEEFGTRLRKTREGRNWSQARMAEVLTEHGITAYPTTVAKIESGERAVKVNELAVFADIFGVSLDALVGRRARPTGDLLYTVETLLNTKSQGRWPVQALLSTMAEQTTEVADADSNGRWAELIEDAQAAVAALTEALAAVDRVGRRPTIGIERAQREMLRRYLNKKDEEDTVDDA
jgi:transcriptional regulator with XRE-family HTH domain